MYGYSTLNLLGNSWLLSDPGTCVGVKPALKPPSNLVNTPAVVKKPAFKMSSKSGSGARYGGGFVASHASTVPGSFAASTIGLRYAGRLLPVTVTPSGRLSFESGGTSPTRCEYP